jgi:hypothetical protein
VSGHQSLFGKNGVEEIQTRIRENMNKDATQEALYYGQPFWISCESDNQMKITMEFLQCHGWEVVVGNNNNIVVSCPKTIQKEIK